jgi:hypothetical protein
MFCLSLFESNLSSKMVLITGNKRFISIISSSIEPIVQTIRPNCQSWSLRHLGIVRNGRQSEEHWTEILSFRLELWMQFSILDFRVALLSESLNSCQNRVIPVRIGLRSACPQKLRTKLWAVLLSFSFKL